jgi:sec-independent protein translocase protein TatB
VFDIGFSEMVVCAVVALVVIGPERLPKVARTLGVLFGRLQRYVAQVKSDINREMDMADLGKVKTEFESAARSFESDFRSQSAELERDVRDAQTAIEVGLAEPSGQSPQLNLGIDEPAPPPLPPKGPGEQ